MIKAFGALIGIVFLLAFLGLGGFGLVLGLIGAIFGLVVGLIGAVVGVAAGLLGAVFGVLGGIAGILLPLIAVVLVLAGIASLVLG